MAIEHLRPDAPAEKVHETLVRDGCAVVDGLLDGSVMDAIREQMTPYIEACPDLGRRLRRATDEAHRRPHRAFRGGARCGDEPARPGHGREAAVPGGELPAAPHPDHRDRAGPGCAADPPRSVGLRLLSVPERLRRPVQHDLGDDRLHRDERRHARDPGQQPPRRQAPVQARGHRVRGDGEGVLLPLHRFGLSRGWREPLGRSPNGTQTSPTTRASCARRRTSTSPAPEKSRRPCPKTSCG